MIPRALPRIWSVSGDAKDSQLVQGERTRVLHRKNITHIIVTEVPLPATQNTYQNGVRDPLGNMQTL